MVKSLLEYFGYCQDSRPLILLIVSVALFLDNMLLTVIVPILPYIVTEIENGGKVNTKVESPIVNGADPICLTQDALERRQNCISEEGGWFNVSGTAEDGVICLSASDQRQLEWAWARNCSNATTLGDAPKDRQAAEPDDGREEKVNFLQVKVSMLFASKPVAQLIANPIVGRISNSIGYTIPVFAGFIILFLSSVMFAIGSRYAVLFVAHALQGVGSGCATVAGLGLLADRFRDDEERGSAMGIAMGALAVGLLVGPPYGGTMYEFVSTSSPMMTLAFLALLFALFQLLVVPPRVQHVEYEGDNITELLKDPYIVIAAGCITFVALSTATIDATLPVWMKETLFTTPAQQGLVFLPATGAYLIAAVFIPPLAYKVGRWLFAMVGMVLTGACVIIVPYMGSFWALLAPNAGWGVASGATETSVMPLLGKLVDERHVAAVYGTVYAIGDIALCLGYAAGPAAGGWIVEFIGFKWGMFIYGMITILYAPLMIFLRNPPTKEENQALTQDEKTVPMKYDAEKSTVE